MERWLAAILAANVVGYSRKMEYAEEEAAARSLACQSCIDDIVRSFGGRVFHRAGDAAMAEFGSPVNALRCTVEIQHRLASEPALELGGDRLHQRIAPHFTDVIVSCADLLGDGHKTLPLA